jgi:hypothetical protein
VQSAARDTNLRPEHGNDTRSEPARESNSRYNDFTKYLVGGPFRSGLGRLKSNYEFRRGEGREGKVGVHAISWFDKVEV